MSDDKLNALRQQRHDQESLNEKSSVVAEDGALQLVRAHNKRLFEENNGLRHENEELANQLEQLRKATGSTEQLLIEKSNLEQKVAELSNRLAESERSLAEVPLLMRQIEDAQSGKEERERLVQSIETLTLELEVTKERYLATASKLAEDLSAAQLERNQAEAENETLRDSEARLGRDVEQGLKENALLSSRNAELERSAGLWGSQNKVDFEGFGDLLGKSEKLGRKSGVFHSLLQLLKEEHSALRKIHDSQTIAGNLSFRTEELISVFEPYRPITEMDVETSEIIEATQLLCGAEIVRRGLMSYLRTGGLEPIRPIPRVTQFDPALHDDIPTHRRTTPRKELDGLVAQRVGVGVLETDESGKRTVIKKAQVGRYVFSQLSST